MRPPALLALALLAGCGYVRPPESMCERFPCAPYVLASGEKDPRDVTVNAVDVYWAAAGNGSLRRWDKRDGELDSVTMVAVGAKGLTLDDGYVYFGRRDGSLVRLSLGTMPLPEPVAQGWAEGRRLVGTAEYLFWSVPQGVGRAAKAGGQSEPLVLVSDPSEVAADASGVYFGAAEALWWVPNDAEQAEPQRLATVTPGLEVLTVALDPTGVWAALVPASGAGPCHLVRASRGPVPEAPPPVTTLASGPDCPVDLAADATHVYALVKRAQDGQFELRRHARPDLPADAQVVPGWEVLSTPRDSAGRLALDDTHVYWTEPEGGRVVRLAKVSRQDG